MKDAVLESKKSKVKKHEVGRPKNPWCRDRLKRRRDHTERRWRRRKLVPSVKKEFFRVLVNLNAADPKQTHVNVFFFPSNYKIPEQ